MILLTTTTDKIQLVTDAAVSSIEVHASYVDYAAGGVTPGRTNTLITTATTTDIVAAPAASTQRQLKSLYIRNSSASSQTTVSIVYNAAGTSYELYSAKIGPQGLIQYSPSDGFTTSSTIYATGDLWAGNIIACVRDGNPNYAMSQMQLGGHVAPTPTNIGATVARCEAFRPAYDITVNRVRWYGIGAVAAIYTMAIYNFLTMARVSEQFTLTTTAANAFESVAVTSQFTLTRGTLYFVAVSANTTGTVAGIGALGGTTASGTGQIVSPSGMLPGNLRVQDGSMSSHRFQLAVTAGAMPTIAPVYTTNTATWTGGMPLFFLDNNTGA